MKKILLVIGLIAVLSMSLIIKHIRKPLTEARFTISILQTASHPALDAAREGFIEELKNRLKHEVEFVVYNAQGSSAQAHAVAQQLQANKNCAGFFAIATPAAQALSAVEKERPLFIAAVTDPHALGLLHPKTNVCGSKDMIDVEAEIEMLTRLVPQAKTVGLLSTAGETNSIAQVKLMRTALEARGLKAIDFALTNETDMQALVELACRKTDLILAPTDNTVASTIALTAAITRKHGKPFIVSDNLLVAQGPLAARGVDYKMSGKHAAQCAHKVLVEGKKPHELPIEQAQSEKIVINQTTLELLGLQIPKALQKQLVLVKDTP